VILHEKLNKKYRIKFFLYEILFPRKMTLKVCQVRVHLIESTAFTVDYLYSYIKWNCIAMEVAMFFKTFDSKDSLQWNPPSRDSTSNPLDSINSCQLKKIHIFENINFKNEKLYGR